MSGKLVLQSRLARLSRLVPQGSRLADIGTDHGYLPVYLCQTERISRAIAADIGEEPLAHARRTAEQYGVSERIDFRLCDGLSGIAPHEADTIVIAGMGGGTICSILQNAPWLTAGGHTLLLQPMSKSEELRPWLVSHGFGIVRETLAEDKGILYPILTVRFGVKTELTEAEAYAGRWTAEEPLAQQWLAERRERLLRAAEGLRCAKNGAGEERAEALRSMAQELEHRREQLR